MKNLTGLFSHPKRRIKNLVKEGEYKEALELGKSLEEKNPNDTDVLFIMGSIYYILEDAKKALDYFDKLLQIKEYDTEALLLKAHIHLFLKEKNETINCCNKILKVDPKNNDAQKIVDYFEEN